MTTGESRRDRMRRENREAILTAARTMLQTEGAAGLNMRAVAARLGYSPSLIYAHFESKAALLGELAHEGRASLGQSMADVLGVASGSWADRIRELARAYRRFAVEQPDLFGLNFGEAGVVTVADAPPTFGLLQHAVASGMEAGEFRAMPPRLSTTVAWAMVHGVVALERAGQLTGSEAGAVLEAAVCDLLRSWAVKQHV